MKLYRYRPISDFLYKELNYQELYFASYNELNDPLDLSVNIDYMPPSKRDTYYLIWSFYKSTMYEIMTGKNSTSNKDNIVEIINSKQKIEEYIELVYGQLSKIQESKGSVTINDLEQLTLFNTQNSSKLFCFESFKKYISSISDKFFNNTSISCFSEDFTNTLMWAHYASNHSGICLEFDFANSQSFPIILKNHTKQLRTTDIENFSYLTSENLVYYKELKKVDYQATQHNINFYYFSPIIENSSDCDVIGLNKSWTHQYSINLESLFSIKTLPWKYEKEWRIIDLKFGEPLEPEERIKHFHLNSLSAIYFGYNTPENVKKRIFKIFESQFISLNYYCMDKNLNVNPWYLTEE